MKELATLLFSSEKWNQKWETNWKIDSLRMGVRNSAGCQILEQELPIQVL